MRATHLAAVLIFVPACFPAYGFDTSPGGAEGGLGDATTDATSDVASSDADASDGMAATDSGADSRAASDSAVSDGGPSTDSATVSDAGADAEGGTVGCAGNAGTTPMVRIDAAGGPFCIDTAEVTQAEFNRFLTSTGGAWPSPPPVCGANAANPLSPIQGRDTLPAIDLHWCAAYSYCKWAGKRLCGRIGGGGDDNGTSATNEWVFACQNGTAATTYPYGSSYLGHACNTLDAEGGVLTPPGTYAACHGLAGGTSAAVFDMMGNVDEYVDDADETIIDGGNVTVYVRGGSYADPNASTNTCQALVFGSGVGPYNYAGDDVGFRCCADVR